MLCGLTTRSAPARRSFSSLSSTRTRADDEEVGTQGAGADGHEQVAGVGVERGHQRPGPIESRLPQHRRRRSRRRRRSGTATSRSRSASRSTMTGAAPESATSLAIDRPTRPQPHTITWTLDVCDLRSMRRLPKTSCRSPSTRVWISTPSAYNAVPTPRRISTIVKTMPASREWSHLAEADRRDRRDRLVDRLEEREPEDQVSDGAGDHDAPEHPQRETEATPVVHVRREGARPARGRAPSIECKRW